MLLEEGWNQLQYDLQPALVKALHTMGFTKMMPVQKAAIPLMMKNYDLAVEAQTGSGKTLAFVIPLIEHLLKRNPSTDEETIHIPLFLILAPTRELCQQSHQLLISLLQHMNSPYSEQVACATGGRPLQDDLARCDKSVLVLMGTVGRVREIITQSQERQKYLRKVDYLYIDEGDRVLKEKGIEVVVKAVPKMRRTAIFSATLQDITQNDLKLYGMRNLAKISLKTTQLKEPAKKDKKEKKIVSEVAAPQTSYAIPESLTNEYAVVTGRTDKLLYLINYIRSHCEGAKAIVFLSTCACVEYYTKLLGSLSYLKRFKVEGIHGKLKPKKRNKIITSFMHKNEASTKGRILLATDVVSRGIDFGDVQFIFQLDPPDDPDNFVHRIGRTARVNRKGYALLFLEEHQLSFVSYLQNKNVPMQEHKLEHLTIDSDEMKECFMNLVLSDHDYIEKAKRAFVSYIRSYKEHELKYIFEFKNMSIGDVANSFFLLRIPRIKEILGKKISGFVQSEIDPDSIPWKDPNQESQYNVRRERVQDEKAAQEADKKKVVDIKNKRSLRKKLKRKLDEQEADQFRKQQKQIRKERNKRYVDEQDLDDLSVATEELQERIAKKKIKLG